MIDLHTHILPGLDDGSQYMEDSLEMAAIAAGCGVRVIVATPHANQMGRFENFFSQDLVDCFQEFQNRVREEGIGFWEEDRFVPLQILLGMEIFASDDMENKIRRNQLIGLNGSRFCLVEWAFDELPERIFGYLMQIRNAGKIPLIAHPERYYCVQDQPELLYEWIQMGCFAQINKGSLFGKFGSRAMHTAKLLLEYDLVTCAATDAHSPRMRTTFMADGWDYLEDKYGSGQARRLLYSNPLKILNDQMPHLHGRRPDYERMYY